MQYVALSISLAPLSRLLQTAGLTKSALIGRMEGLEEKIVMATDLIKMLMTRINPCVEEVKGADIRNLADGSRFIINLRHKIHRLRKLL